MSSRLWVFLKVPPALFRKQNSKNYFWTLSEPHKTFLEWFFKTQHRFGSLIIDSGEHRPLESKNEPGTDAMFVCINIWTDFEIFSSLTCSESKNLNIDCISHIKTLVRLIFPNQFLKISFFWILHKIPENPPFFGKSRGSNQTLAEIWNIKTNVSSTTTPSITVFCSTMLLSCFFHNLSKHLL